MNYFFIILISIYYFKSFGNDKCQFGKKKNLNLSNSNQAIINHLVPWNSNDYLIEIQRISCHSITTTFDDRIIKKQWPKNEFVLLYSYIFQKVKVSVFTNRTFVPLWIFWLLYLVDLDSLNEMDHDALQVQGQHHLLDIWKF